MSDSKQIIFEAKRTPSIVSRQDCLWRLPDSPSRGVGEYFVHVVGFYLNLAIFTTWKSFQHGLINYLDTKAKCRRLKNLPVKGLCGRCLFVWAPPYTLYTYFILIHTGKGFRVGKSWTREKIRGSTVYEAGSKIPTYDWNVTPVYRSIFFIWLLYS
jgi:hypothetical protein